MKKNVYVHTFGCQMNVYDSDRMTAMLGGYGYSPIDRADRADLIIVNTCSIREKAAQKAFSQLGRYRKLKIQNPKLIIALGGCIAQQEAEEVFKRAPYLDLVFGTQNINRLPEFIRTIEENGGRLANVTPEATYLESLDEPLVPLSGAVTAFVTIMQGCDNYCAFCIVPYLRGREASRKKASIVHEIKEMVARGVLEVTLLGQNVNSYGRKDGTTSFRDLLAEIAAIEGLMRIRFTTSHPRDLSDDVIGLFGSMGKLCQHIHLPVQSGSDRILSLMNRGYGREDYLAKVARLREYSPDISITSDMIVGFPGEEEQDFSDTLELMDRVRFDGLFSFKYSERKGTAAVALPGKVAEGIKGERLRILQSLQERHTLEKNRSWEGRPVEVLVERVSENHEEDLTGRTSTNRVVNFKGDPEQVGSLVKVLITGAYLHSLRGETGRRKKDDDRNESIRVDLGSADQYPDRHP